MKTNLKANCAEYEYNSDKTASNCIKCHNPAWFDFDGANRFTSANPNFNERHFTRWISSKRVDTTYAGHTCTNYPIDFITNPAELFSYLLKAGDKIDIAKNAALDTD